MRFLAISAVGALLFMGCQHAPESKDPAAEFAPKPSRSSPVARRVPPAVPPLAPAPPRITPIQENSGRVIAQNAPLRYVVLEFFLTSLPAVDQRMGIYRDGQKVGEAKVTGPARDRNIVADLTAGEAKVGDEVRPE